ncbi:hypothetical protein [Candidatus Accumulibacter sp. ACC003]|uniref:hypothetical protein n=1 Tax=Candidatus Accumulibacter sp. ACC003 TaxID=2823334 RepID=UPI0025BBBF6D|nr:hypothetical protein [Candidatus Accumulibacter sp. ACC003]
MQSIPEELLYVLVFLVILAFQYLTKRFGPQAPEEPAGDEQFSEIPEELTDSAAAAALAGIADDAPGRSDAPAVAPGRRRYSRSSLLGSRRAVQDGVVMATILGPCRAFDPHDVRQ